MTELRRRDVACDADYGGRSLKGQLTHAGRLGARTVVVVGPDGATIRERGKEDVRVSLDDLLATLGR
jgi:histidyl-tRNA synthetase